MSDNKLEKLRSREKIFLIIGCVFLGQAGSNFDFGQYVTAIVFFAIWVACTVGVFITSSKITHREFELERPTGKWTRVKRTSYGGFEYSYYKCSNCGNLSIPSSDYCAKCGAEMLK